MNIETLRKLNPQLPFFTVNDPAFKRFGRVMAYDAKPMMDACHRALTMPETGSAYQLSLDALEALPDATWFQNVVFGESPAQLGICYGHSSQLNALEYHRASEINVAVTDMVLLLADERDMVGNTLDAAKVQAFFVPEGTTIEVYGTTLHFCPCQTSDAGFICVVGLPKGTNAPLEKPQTAKDGEARLLFRQNKWLLCHEHNDALIARGVFPGISGENYTVRY